MEVTDTTLPVMQEEIFGPVLPLVTFEREEEVAEFVGSRPRPLALYYFGRRRSAKRVMEQCLSGGACINDTILHIANENAPFGGVGNSGMGRYHGRESFLAFSHLRTVVTTPTWLDIPLRYMPYKGFSITKRLL